MACTIRRRCHRGLTLLRCRSRASSPVTLCAPPPLSPRRSARAYAWLIVKHRLGLSLHCIPPTEKPSLTPLDDVTLKTTPPLLRRTTLWDSSTRKLWLEAAAEGPDLEFGDRFQGESGSGGGRGVGKLGERSGRLVVVCVKKKVVALGRCDDETSIELTKRNTIYHPSKKSTYECET